MKSRDMNSAFDPELWKASAGGGALSSVLPAGRRAGQPGLRRRQPRARSTRSPARSCRSPSPGPSCPGTGDIANGQFTGGLPGKKSGWYYDMPALSWAPRVGIAWDVTGDQKTAIRASGGIFYNFINRSQYLYNGGPLVSQVRSVLNATLDEHRRRRPRRGTWW